VATTFYESVRLSPQEVEDLEAHHPELREGRHAGQRQALAVAGPDHLLAMVEALLQQFAWKEARDARVLEALAPDLESAVISEERLQQLRLRADAQATFRKSVELLTSAMVGELGGSAANNASALASRWKTEGRIFAVPSGRADLFPAFQFDAHGQPRPAVKVVVRLLAEANDWGRALWWSAPSGWLGGRRPLEVLSEDPEAVVEAARRTAQPLQV
jgi:hypothetical protein